MASYTIPAYGSTGPTVMQYLLEALSEGEGWLKSQRNTTNWDAIADVLSVNDARFDLAGQSNTGYNKTKRIARELVASLSNFRHEGEFRINQDQELYDAAAHLTKRDQAWFRSTKVHQSMRSIMQYGVGFGTGYAYQVWDRDYWGPGRGDIRLTPVAPDDVFCVQLPADHDLQKAYAVIIRFEVPINLARRIYHKTNPAFANALQPDRDSPGWIEKGLRKVQEIMGGSPIFRLGGRDRKTTGNFPTVDIFHAYINDGSLNLGTEPRQMGTYDTNWSYTVPAYGTPIDTGLVKDGLPVTRIATEDDALMFPLRRLCIFSRGVDFPAYDGSSPWWHGQVPLGKFQFGDWAWEPLGQSLLGECLTMQKGIEGLMQNIEDSGHARMDPPLLYDDNHVSKSFAEAVNPRRAGVRAAANLNLGEVFKVMGEQWQYEVPQWIAGWIQQQESRMDYLTATPDITAIAKAKQLPGEGTLEKLMEMAGPLVQDMIRGVEEPLLTLGEQRKALYFQFDTKSRWMEIDGPDGVTEHFYFDPVLITPDTKRKSGETLRGQMRRLISEFHFHLSQSGVNEIHRMVNKLAYLQLAKAGIPLSWWTIAKIWQIPNFGPEPTKADGKPVANELERWVAQQHMIRELQEELQAGVEGAKQGPGRPQTYAVPPHLETKDGGTRTTIATSE